MMKTYTYIELFDQIIARDSLVPAGTKQAQDVDI